MKLGEKTVEYCFDSKIYSGEDIKIKIEDIKKSFNKISNKPIEVRVELNELGIYVLSFKIYAKRKIGKKKSDMINKIYIESIKNNEDDYINNLINKKEDKFIRKLNDENKTQQKLNKKIKENKEQKELNKRIKENKESKERKKINTKQEQKRDKTEEEKRKPRIVYLYRQEEEKSFAEMINEMLQALKNIKIPKLEHKNKVYNTKTINSDMGEKHYWSDNYIPKEYGKYKASKKIYKPL